MEDIFCVLKRIIMKKIVKNIITTLDKRFNTNIYERAIMIQKFWYDSGFLNTIRRNIDPNIVRLTHKLRLKDEGPLKLHLGCGNEHLEDYVNIDWRKTGATDLVCDIRDLPYDNNSVDLIETYHVIEHLPRYDLPEAFEEWSRILKPEGCLIIECPDFDEIAERYLEGDEKQLDGIFGLQRFKGDTHYFGYNFKRLSKMVRDYGFLRIAKKDARDYHAKEMPCIRIECTKVAERDCVHRNKTVEGKTPRMTY